MKSDLVIVYHRQPYEEVIENGQVQYRENSSPNGIVPTMKGLSWAGRSRRVGRLERGRGYRQSRFRAGDRDFRQFRHLHGQPPAIDQGAGQQLLSRHQQGSLLAHPARVQGTLQLRPGRLADLPRRELGLCRSRRRTGHGGRRDLGARLQPVAGAGLSAAVEAQCHDLFLPPHAVSGAGHVQCAAVARRDHQQPDDLRQRGLSHSALCAEFRGRGAVHQGGAADIRGRNAQHIIRHRGRAERPAHAADAGAYGGHDLRAHQPGGREFRLYRNAGQHIGNEGARSRNPRRDGGCQADPVGVAHGLHQGQYRTAWKPSSACCCAAPTCAGRCG